MTDHKPLIIGFTALAIFFVLMILRSTDTYSPTPPPTAPAQEASVPTYGGGTYRVGQDIQPGTYHTSGAGVLVCYYARLAELNEDPIDSDVFYGPWYLEVATTDQYIKLSGRCEWSPT